MWGNSCRLSPGSYPANYLGLNVTIENGDRIPMHGKGHRVSPKDKQVFWGLLKVLINVESPIPPPIFDTKCQHTGNPRASTQRTTAKGNPRHKICSPTRIHLTKKQWLLPHKDLGCNSPTRSCLNKSLSFSASTPQHLCPCPAKKHP